MIQKVTSFLKSGGVAVLVIGGFFLILTLFILFVGGTIALYTKYLSGILLDLDELASALAVLFLFLCIFRKCRVFAGTALVLCSYVIAVDLWFQSLVSTYISFGIVGVFIGIVILGVGIYFTGLAALLWAHLYGAFLSYVIALAIMYGIRVIGLHFAKQETEQRYESDLYEPDPQQDMEGVTGGAWEVIQLPAEKAREVKKGNKPLNEAGRAALERYLGETGQLEDGISKSKLAISTKPGESAWKAEDMYKSPAFKDSVVKYLQEIGQIPTEPDSETIPDKT